MHYMYSRSFTGAQLPTVYSYSIDLEFMYPYLRKSTIITNYDRLNQINHSPYYPFVLLVLCKIYMYIFAVENLAECLQSYK